MSGAMNKRTQRSSVVASEEAEAIALLHAVALFRPHHDRGPRGWQHVADAVVAELSKGGPRWMQLSYQPQRAKAQYELLVTQFRLAVASNGAEAALPSSSVLWELLEKAVAEEDAREGSSPESVIDFTGDSSGSSEPRPSRRDDEEQKEQASTILRVAPRAARRLSTTPSPPAPAKLQHEEVVKPRRASAPVKSTATPVSLVSLTLPSTPSIVMARHASARKRQWDSRLVASRRVMRRVELMKETKEDGTTTPRHEASSGADEMSSALGEHQADDAFEPLEEDTSLSTEAMFFAAANEAPVDGTEAAVTQLIEQGDGPSVEQGGEADPQIRGLQESKTPLSFTAQTASAQTASISDDSGATSTVQASTELPTDMPAHTSPVPVDVSAQPAAALVGIPSRSEDMEEHQASSPLAASSVEVQSPCSSPKRSDHPDTEESPGDTERITCSTDTTDDLRTLSAKFKEQGMSRSLKIKALESTVEEQGKLLQDQASTISLQESKLAWLEIRDELLSESLQQLKDEVTAMHRARGDGEQKIQVKYEELADRAQKEAKERERELLDSNTALERNFRSLEAENAALQQDCRSLQARTELLERQMEAYQGFHEEYTARMVASDAKVEALECGATKISQQFLDLHAQVDVEVDTTKSLRESTESDRQAQQKWMDDAKREREELVTNFQRICDEAVSCAVERVQGQFEISIIDLNQDAVSLANRLEQVERSTKAHDGFHVEQMATLKAYDSKLDKLERATVAMTALVEQLENQLVQEMNRAAEQQPTHPALEQSIRAELERTVSRIERRVEESEAKQEDEAVAWQSVKAMQLDLKESLAKLEASVEDDRQTGTNRYTNVLATLKSILESM